MIIVDEVPSAVSTALDLAKKHQDAETVKELVNVYTMILELKKENEALKAEVEEYKKRELFQNDLCLDEKGLYYKKSELQAGKKIRYCAACYNNYGKLYPITQGSLRKDYFCTNCRMHYTGWNPSAE